MITAASTNIKKAVVWEVYEYQTALVESDIATAIINCLGEKTSLFFSYLIRPERTRFVKRELIKLGHKSGFKVYANGLTNEDLIEIDEEFVNREWLYDIHWFTNGKEPYSVESLPLVVECEWNPRRKGDGKIPYSGVKYDFQKLVVANAELRLMIFIIKKDNELAVLGKYFDDVIQNYKHLNQGAKFLFIAYNSNMLCFHYTLLIKR